MSESGPFAHLQRLPSAVPGAGEFGDEFFEFVELAHGEAQEGDAGGGEEVVHENVPVFAVGPLIESHPRVPDCQPARSVILENPVGQQNGLILLSPFCCHVAFLPGGLTKPDDAE